jgi:hypothetical protein
MVKTMTHEGLLLLERMLSDIEAKPRGQKVDLESNADKIGAAIVLVGAKPEQAYLHYIRDALRRNRQIVYLMAEGSWIPKAEAISQQLSQEDHRVALYKTDRTYSRASIHNKALSAVLITLIVSSGAESLGEEFASNSPQ